MVEAMKPEIDTLAAARGITVEARQKWRERGSVPHRWRIPLLQDAAVTGAKITAEDMEFPSSKGAPSRSRTRARQQRAEAA